ncbi:MAG: hypothetical protein U0W24_21490 [Bacteroidales bacterium]
METLDKKNKILAIVFLTVALVLSIITFIVNPWYMLIIFPIGIYALIQVEKPKYILIFSAILLILACPVILVVRKSMEEYTLRMMNDSMEEFFKTIIISTLVLFVPYFFAGMYFKEILKLIENQKRFPNLFAGYPYLVCREHFVKTKEYSVFSYKGIKCRFTNYCLDSGNLLEAAQLVGLIGILSDGKLVGNQYFTTLWDHRHRKIRYGDYDVIEIHQNAEIQDYDFVISKIITFFYNETKRFKPLNHTIVKLSAKVPLSENSKLLLQKHFLSVEYFK